MKFILSSILFLSLFLFLDSATTSRPTQRPLTRTTYNWGQHTGTGFRTTYNWGQHTRTTYDWGQHTATPKRSTPAPAVVTTQNYKYKCQPGKYACKGAFSMCLTMQQVCDGKIDCPHGDDERKITCYPQLVDRNSNSDNNHFAGNGFMFRIRNIKISRNSDVKLFNQMSDNSNQ